MENSGQLQGKTLLVVNTGSFKKKFIFQRLKRLGLNLVVLNVQKNWAQTYVDYWILADTYQHGEALAAVRTFLSENPKVVIDGAVTFWEDDIPLLARLCHEFKWKGNTLDAAFNTRDKFKMQEVFRVCGLPHIKSQLLKNKADVETAIEQIGFPAVIKPVFGSDSQYVVYVSDKEEARDAYQYVLKNCTPEYDPIYKYNKKLFVYQEFIEGHEFSLECFCQHGVPHITGIHEKTAMELPFFMETGDYIPPRVSPEQLEALHSATEAALIVLGVRDSLAHVEVKLTTNGPRVIEVASRLGGDYTYDAIVAVTGFDLIKAGAEVALGINAGNGVKSTGRYVMGKFFIPKNSGVITKIIGWDELRENKNVVSRFLAKQVGDSVLVPPDGYENIGWVLVDGDSYAEVEMAMTNIFSSVRIEVTPFRSYSSIGRTERKNRFSSALLAKRGAVSQTRIEHIRKASAETQRNLHIGIACNIYETSEGGGEVEQDLMSVGKNIEKTLVARGYRVTFFDFNDLSNAFKELKGSDVDMVFNVCERINDSSLLEPHAAAILDTLQIPYTGSNPFTLGLCIDKVRVKKLLAYHHIPTPRWDYAYSDEDKIDEDLRYPLIVKPANTDNSIGITNDSVVTNKEDLYRQIKKVTEELDSPALIEEYIEGDEYDVTVIGNDEDDLRVLPLSRSIFKEMPEGYWHIYPYDAKWGDNPAYRAIIRQRPAKNIDKKLEALLSEIALDTYNILDCHDYGRVEVRVDESGNPYVLELNPNPSINMEDCIPAQAELVGLNYGDFLEEIILMAIKRYKDKPPYYHLQTALF
jgi:D-alanine-D-alanine ligase